MESLITPERSQLGGLVMPLLARKRAWPLHTYLELGALPTAVPCARLHARQLLWEWRLERYSENVELVVSELVTNAVTASRALEEQPRAVRLWLLSDETRVLVLVWDASPQAPVRADAEVDTEADRGLLLVDAMCVTWDWYLLEGADGKIVWGEVRPPALSR